MTLHKFTSGTFNNHKGFQLTLVLVLQVGANIWKCKNYIVTYFHRININILLSKPNGIQWIRFWVNINELPLTPLHKDTTQNVVLLMHRVFILRLHSYGKYSWERNKVNYFQREDRCPLNCYGNLLICFLSQYD